jgi:hypothetical protein
LKLDKKALLLTLASIFFTLFVCELALQLLTPYGPRNASETAPSLPPTADKPLDTGEAAQYIAALPAAPGTDRKWFSEDPPPLPNRQQVSPQRVQRYKDFERRGLYGPQADYIWNRVYVERERCNPNTIFRNYPSTVLVFDPPGGDIHPHYRFAPSTTTFAKLVTNDFGLRGPPLTLVKPPRTIRIAFLGASTTVNTHSYPFSYPERVVYWLNRFAESNHYEVKFEVLNAGREGLSSEDFSAIVRDELLPLDPDLAVYYEGANQFNAGRMVVPPISSRQQIDPRDPVGTHIVPAALRNHFALGSIIDRVLNGFSSLNEPRKPLHVLVWHISVNEQNPDVSSPKLPLHLPTIVKDLDAIRASLQSIGGRLVLCSFEWLAKDGLQLSGTRHAFIYKQLNTELWPLRYAEIRRLADFQNRVFRRYAEARQIPFIDVASMLPQDPNLFVDAIHMTDTGERVKAWIVFQQLVPMLRMQIESGQLPRSASQHLAPRPSLAARELEISCKPPAR